MSLGDSYTKRGPGRTHQGEVMPAGTKLIKRFIRQATGENSTYRRDLQAIEERAVSQKRHSNGSFGRVGSHNPLTHLLRMARLLSNGRSK